MLPRDEIIEILSGRQMQLAAHFGVKSLRLFGSVARAEAVAGSDIDLLVEFDRPIGYFELIRLQEQLSESLGVKVDLGTPESLKPRMKERILAEAINVIPK